MSRLPLPADLCRCLGHASSGYRVAPGITGDGCPKSEECARHVTIRWETFGAQTSVVDHLCEPGTTECFIAAYVEGQP